MSVQDEQNNENREDMYRKFIKRALDVILSGLAIPILFPFCFLIAVWIRLDSKGPAFFRQTRIGIDDTTFEIVKFRTMQVDAPSEVPTHLMVDADRWLTRAGRILRRTSLDELPQVLNIFKGDMSIVGPRPALWNQDDLIALRQANGANRVRPGLTGLAQVHGRDILSVEDKAGYDGVYAKNITFAADAKCIWMTVIAVLTGKDVIEGSRDLPKNRKRK